MGSRPCSLRISHVLSFTKQLRQPSILWNGHDKIRDDLTIARDSMITQQDSNESSNSNPLANKNSQAALGDPDVHMFHEDDNILTCNEQQDYELMYTNTIQHHKDNPSLSQVDKDADILSILRLLHSTDIVKLLHPTVQFFTSSVARTFHTES